MCVQLNLVVNEQNSVHEIGHTIPNIPLFCETRWSEKYKYIRLFNNNLIKIKRPLGDLSSSTNVNVFTKNCAYKLLSATSNSGFQWT